MHRPYRLVDGRTPSFGGLIDFICDVSSVSQIAVENLFGFICLWDLKKHSGCG